MEFSIESDVQFLARMLLNMREGHQIANQDILRLQSLAQFGPGPVPPTPPEAHPPSNRQILPASRGAHGEPVR
jgi:hypothetical protein